MQKNPLDIPISSNTLYSLARANQLTASALEYSLRRIGIIPDAKAWRKFIDNLLLLLSTTLLLVGIIFFFAYNWADLNHFAKFGLLQASLLTLAVFASWRGLERLEGKVALLATAVLLGTLLAVYGQTYQTGADAFSLFMTWAILIIPWVLLGTFAPLWLLLLVLLNLSLILYYGQVINPPSHGPHTELFLLLFMLNGTAMLVWENVQLRSIAWLRGHWLGVLIFSTILIVLITPTLYAIVSNNWQLHPLLAVAVGLYAATTALALWYYRYQRHDLLLLAACLLGLLIVLTTLAAKLLPFDKVLNMLILALLIIGQASLATNWLRHVAQTWQKEAQ
ncbi:MAG: DUF2157 domain-containing protein [Pseudomonadota bacterium]